MHSVRARIRRLMHFPPFAGAISGPGIEAGNLSKAGRQFTSRLRAIRGLLGQAIENHAIERRRDRQLAP